MCRAKRHLASRCLRRLCALVSVLRAGRLGRHASLTHFELSFKNLFHDRGFTPPRWFHFRPRFKGKSMKSLFCLCVALGIVLFSASESFARGGGGGGRGGGRGGGA